MSTEIVKGRRATICFDAKRCVDSRGCAPTHPDVFVPNVVGDWIHPDTQGKAELLHVAKNCPSGAIRVVATNADGASVNSDEAPLVHTMRLRETGSTKCRSESTMRRAPQLGQKPRCLQEKAIRLSPCQCSHTTRKKPWSITPQRR